MALSAEHRLVDSRKKFSEVATSVFGHLLTRHLPDVLAEIVVVEIPVERGGQRGFEKGHSNRKAFRQVSVERGCEPGNALLQLQFGKTGEHLLLERFVFEIRGFRVNVVRELGNRLFIEQLVF